MSSCHERRDMLHLFWNCESCYMYFEIYMMKYCLTKKMLPKYSFMVLSFWFTLGIVVIICIKVTKQFKTMDIKDKMRCVLCDF